jgi:hypothetical protein
MTPEISARKERGQVRGDASPKIRSALMAHYDFRSLSPHDFELLCRDLLQLRERGLEQQDAPFVAARQCLLTRPETDEEFRAAASFCERYPNAVSEGERETLRQQFVEFASDHPLRWDDDPDTLRSVASAIEYVGSDWA